MMQWYYVSRIRVNIHDGAPVFWVKHLFVVDISDVKRVRQPLRGRASGRWDKSPALVGSSHGW
ncbi:MAG: hypothetical protein GY938_23695 [Ketobacter sp.]|nr:hypothetical protein [Ketobacter sp.]